MPASSASVHLYPIPPSIPQPGLPTGLKIVSRSTETRASNAARAALVVADVTPTGYRVGKFLASHARYATAADVRRHVVPGELFTFWPQAKIAAEMGCSERQVRRGVRSMREAGALEVRRRVRPCEASYVWVLPGRSDGAGVLSGVRSGVLSGVRSHTEPRTEPQKNHEGSSRAREVCKICGNNWPAEYGEKCYQCPQPTASQIRRRAQEKRNEEAGAEFERELLGGTPTDDKPKADVPACTCGDAYRQSYGRRCVDCEGEPSPAQRDAVREKHGCRGVDDRVGEDGGVADNPSVPETETRQPPETRGQSPDNYVSPEHEIPPDGGEGEDEPPPKSDRDALLRFWKKARADFNRKYHKGGTDDGHIKASGHDGSEGHRRGAAAPGRG